MSVQRRVTKRRGQTRQRLLDAALVVFAAEGFGRSTIEQICDRAGYTRGAFYSNFASLEELFLAMWEQHSRRMLAEVEAALDAARTAGVDDVRTAVERLLEAVPVDDDWYRVTAEFSAHALRNPALRRVVVAREEAIAAAIVPGIEALLNRIGRQVPDPVALGQALVAVHDGTAVQCLMEPGGPAVRRRVDLFEQVVLAYSVESRG
ncbi:DNA-binding transcriptional regulator, AcrR family [Saccharopolyspora antimicrobica]|uniref:DNA-binding transcriptional regulator, AcrR family n=1 Tax=Saccharopolyspora antimicrobica TaxID=455193 RepID=A0A1I5L898_9PSEU|nr:TetR/AcrR family transcriptional regulator [Saccharopolyspora antimicrobica]RKT86859.1 TetR family transcriptional regulator [Saccharopolyspora antimicrobica]SFO93403.1 DNA-binding transcriptional regulator, AcrR family [Saccharopolyspora antimicrobica]